MTVTKKQAVKNRTMVREYWRSYLYDGHIMAWLVADSDGDVWMTDEPQGQTYKVFREDCRVIHQFGDFYRAHGELPAHITLKAFTAELDIADYLTA